MSWFDHEYYGSTLPQWIAAFSIGFALALAFYYVRRIVANRLRARAARTVTRADDLLAEIFARTYFVFLFILALYLGLQYLDLPSRFARLVDRILVLALLLQIALWGNRAIKWWLSGAPTKTPGADAASTTTVAVLGFTARVALWAFVLLMVLDNVGVDITALVAGLGIGGIAVALAVQNILGDLFASLSIALDKPFEVGDFIIVGNEMGTVEYIGIKTTRVRSLTGEQIILANADILNSRIRNYKRMSERRIQFGFGVVYETPPDALARVPDMVRAIIEAQKDTRFDRAHFKSYGESSLDFEIVYFVKTPDYNKYMDIQQAINLALLRCFQAEGIVFAYPTRTLYVADVASGELDEGGERAESSKA